MPNRRNLWVVGLFVLVLGVAVFSMRGRIAAATAMYREYERIPHDTGWIRLRDGSMVSLAPGARLRGQRKPGPSGLSVILEGSARFRAERFDPSAATPELKPFAVRTRNADVITTRGEFGVSVRGDTTEVAVFRPNRQAFSRFIALPSHVLVDDRVSTNPVTVNETEVVRVVRGTRATIIGRTPQVPANR
jgi:ferric-dicitrate binding protein FerR (iron transport regulator)